MNVKSLPRHRRGEPLGVVNGRPIWMICGAADDDGTEGSGAEGNDSDDDPDKDGDDSDDGDSSAETVVTAVSREEYERLLNRMKNADRRASQAENRVKEFEDKDKTELQKAQAALQAAEKDRDEARQNLKNERLRNSFLANNKYSWHDPDVAFAQLDLSSVEIDDDGKITGMGDAIKSLASAKKFLVSDEKDVKPASGASGSTHNGRRKGGDDDAAAADRKRRFPNVYR